MAKFSLAKAETSVILTVFIQDSSATTGAGLGSLIETSSIVGGYVKRNGTGVALAVDENVTTEGTYQAPSAAGKVRIGTPANMRTGVYELHFHNDLFTTEDWVTIALGGATNMAELLIEVQLGVNLSDGVRGAMTALPDAAADAGGGLPISDNGGLDLDTKLANTNEVTVARMGALTDWVNGGRLDLLLDAIPTTAMRGTDSAALASVCTETRLAALTDWLNGGRLDLLLDAIPTTAMRGTDSAALASVCTETRLAALTDWLNGGRLDVILDARASQTTADAIETDTQDIQTQIGTAGAGLSAIPWNAAWDAEVESEVNDALDTVIAELGVAAPAVTPTLRTGLMLGYMALRNLTKVQTSGIDALEIHNDAGTKITSKLVTDDGADYEEAKMT